MSFFQKLFSGELLKPKTRPTPPPKTNAEITMEKKM